MRFCHGVLLPGDRQASRNRSLVLLGACGSGDGPDRSSHGVERSRGCPSATLTRVWDIGGGAPRPHEGAGEAQQSRDVEHD